MLFPMSMSRLRPRRRRFEPNELPPGTDSEGEAPAARRGPARLEAVEKYLREHPELLAGGGGTVSVGGEGGPWRCRRAPKR